MTREEQQLTAIESRLRRSDPGLAEMFTAFTHQPTLRQGPVREHLTPWRPATRSAARKVALFVVMACLLIASIAAAVVAGGHHEGPLRRTPSTAVWRTGARR